MTNLIDIVGLDLAVAGTELLVGFDLKVPAASRIGIAGPSGCGKTTLIRSIVEGKPPLGSSFTTFHSVSQLDKIGYVPQSDGLIPWFSVGRNLESVGAAPHEIEGLLRAVELCHRRDAFSDTLSGGEKQRAKLAMSIAVDPRLWIVDEPLTAVDMGMKWRILEMWSDIIAARSGSLVMVCHELDVLMYMSDVIVVMKNSSESLVFKVDASHPRTMNLLSSEGLVSTKEEILWALGK